MPKDTLYPEDDQTDYQDYYTTPASPGDALSSESGRAVAFDDPAANGIRYPMATPQSGSWQPDAAPSLNGANGGTYVPGSENLPALPGGGYNQAYAADELKQQSGGNPHAVQEAIRLQGLREYEKLIAGGATNSEAMRLAAPKLYFNHPQAMNSAMKFAGTGIEPKVTAIPVPGGTAVFDSNGRLHSVVKNPIQRAAPVVKDVVPPDVKQLQKNKNTEIDLAKGDIVRANKKLDAAVSDEDKLKAANDVLAAKKAFKKLGGEAVVASTNYPHAGPQPPAGIMQAPSDSNTPKVGDVRGGYKFNGKFPPSDKRAWDKE